MEEQREMNKRVEAFIEKTEEKLCKVNEKVEELEGSFVNIAGKVMVLLEHHKEENGEHEEDEDEAIIRIDAEEKSTKKLLDKLSNSSFKFTLSSELRIETDSIRLCKYLYKEKNKLESLCRN